MISGSFFFIAVLFIRSGALKCRFLFLFFFTNNPGALINVTHAATNEVRQHSPKGFNINNRW